MKNNGERYEKKIIKKAYGQIFSEKLPQERHDSFENERQASSCEALWLQPLEGTENIC